MAFRGRAQWELALRALAESLERNQGQAAPIPRSSSEATADVSRSTEFLVSEWADFNEPSPSSSSHHGTPSSTAMNPLRPHTSSVPPVSRNRWNDSADHDRSRFESERRVDEAERRFLSGDEDDEEGATAAAVATEWAEAIAALRRFKPEGWSKMAADCAAQQHRALDAPSHLNDRRGEPPRSRPHETVGRDRHLVTANDPRSSSLHNERFHQQAARTDVDAPAPQRDDGESKEASSSSPSADLREEDPSVNAAPDQPASSEVPFPRRQGRGMTPRPRPEALAEAVRIKSLRSSRFDTSGDAAWRRTLTLPLHPQTFKRRWRALCRNIHRSVLESTSSTSTQHQALQPEGRVPEAPQPASKSVDDSIDALLNPPSISSSDISTSSSFTIASSESSRPLITHEDGLIIKAWFLKREFANISKATPATSSSTRVKNGTHDDALAKRERLPHPFMDHQSAASMKKGPSSTREVEGHDDGHEQVNTPAEVENEMEGTTIHDFEPDSLASDAMEQRHPDADGGEQLRVHSEMEHQDHAAPGPVVHNVDRMSSPREKTEQLSERRLQFLSFLQYQAIAMALAKGSLSHARHIDAAEEMKQNSSGHAIAEVVREGDADSRQSGQADSSSQIHPADEHHTEVLSHGKSTGNVKTSHAPSTEMVPTSVTRREAVMLLRICGAPHAFTLDALREIDAAPTSSTTASSSSPSFSAPRDLEGTIVQCLSVAERRGLERLSETARTRGERAVAQASALAQRLEHSLLDALSGRKSDVAMTIEGTANIAFEEKSPDVRHFPFSDKDWTEATRLVRWCAASTSISGSVVCLLLEPLLFSLFVHRHIRNQCVSSGSNNSGSNTSTDRFTSRDASSSFGNTVVGQHNSSSARYDEIQEVATARALELTALLCAALPGTSSAPHTNQNPTMNRSTTRHQRQLPIEVHTVWRLHDAMTRSPLLSLLLPNAMRLLPVRFAPHDSQLVSSKTSSPVSPQGSTIQGFSREGCVGEQESVSSHTTVPIEKQRQKCEGDDVKQESETHTAGPIEGTHRQKSVSLTWLLSRQASTTAAGRRASKAMSSMFTHHRSLFWSPVSERWLSASQPSPSSSLTSAFFAADAVSGIASSDSSRSEADLKREASPVLPSDVKSSLQFIKQSLEEWFSVDSVAALRPDEWTALFSKPDLRPSMRLKLLTAFLNDCDTAVADESLLDAVMASAAKCKYSPYEDQPLEPRRDISSPASAPVSTPMSGHSQVMTVTSAASVANATPQQSSTSSTPRSSHAQQNAMVDVSTEAQKKSVGSDPGLEVVAALLASNRIPPVLRTKVATVLTQSQLESPAQFQSRRDLDDLDSDIGHSNAPTSSVRSTSTTTAVVVPATMISTEPSCDVLLRGLLRHFPVTSHRSDCLLRAGFVQVMHCTSPGVNSWDGRATAALSVAYARTGEWVKAIGLLTSPKVMWSAADARQRERSVLETRRAARRLKAEEAEKEALLQTVQPVRSSFMRPKGSSEDQVVSTRTTSSFPDTSLLKAKKIAANEESKTRQTGAENVQVNRHTSNRVEAARALAAVLCHLPPRAARVRVRSSDVSPELSSSNLSQHSEKLSADSHAHRSSSTPTNGSGHPMGNSDHIPIDEMSPGQRRVLTTSIGAALASRLGVEGRVGTAIRRVQRYFQSDDSDSSLASRTAAAFQRNRQDLPSAEKASMPNEGEKESEENVAVRVENDSEKRRQLNDDGAKKRERMRPWRKDIEKKRHPTLYPLDIVLAATASPEAHLALLGRRYQTEIERSVALLRSFAAVRLEEIPPPSPDEECHAETDKSVEKSDRGLITDSKRADSESAAEFAQKAESQTIEDVVKDDEKYEEPHTALDKKLRHGRIPWAHLSLSPGIHPHVLSWFWRDTPRGLWSRDLWALYMTRGTWLRAAEIVRAQLSPSSSQSSNPNTSTTLTASGVGESMHAVLPVKKGAEGTGTSVAFNQQALVPLSNDVLNNLCNVPVSFVRELFDSSLNRFRSTDCSSPGPETDRTSQRADSLPQLNRFPSADFSTSQRAFKMNESGYMRTNVGPAVSSAGLPLATAASVLNKIAARDFSAAFDSLMYLAKTGSPMVPLYRPLLTEVLSLYRDETERQQVLDAVAKKERMDAKSAQKTAEKAAIVAELKARIAAGFAKHKPRSNENDDYVAPALTKPEREVAATSTAAPSSTTTAATGSDARSREPQQQMPQQQMYHERKDWVIRARKLLRLRLYTLDVKAGKVALTNSTSGTGRKPHKSSSQSQIVHHISSRSSDSHSSSKPTENLRWSDLSRTDKTVSQEESAAKRTGRAVSPVTGYVDQTNGESVALPSYVSSAESQRFVKPLAFIAAAVYFLCEAEGVYLAPEIHRGMARVAATEHFGVGAVSGMLIVAANIQRKESLSHRTKSSSKSSDGRGGSATLMSSTASTNTVGGASRLLLAAPSTDHAVEVDDDGDGDSTDFSRSEVLQLLPVTTTATSDVSPSGNLAQSGDLTSDTGHTTLSESLVSSSSGSAPSSRPPPTSSSSSEKKKRSAGPTQLFTRPKRKQHSVASSSTDAIFEGLRETSNEDKVIRSQYVSKVTPEDLALALFACRDAAPRHGRGGHARGGRESTDSDGNSSPFSSSRNRDDKAKARADHVGNKSDRAEWERVLSVVLSSPKPVRRAVPVSLWLEGLLLAADQIRERIAISASRSRWAPTQQMPDRQGATWSQTQADKKKSSSHGGPEWTPPVHVTKLSHLRGAKANSVTGTQFAWLNALRLVMSRNDADERRAHDTNVVGASKEGGGEIPTELFLRACRCRELHTRILTGASVLTADEQKARHAVWATVATALTYRGAWMAALDLLQLKPTTAPPPPPPTTTVTTPAAPHSSSSTSSLSSSSLRESESGDAESRTRWTVSKEGVTKTEVSLCDRQFVPRHYKDIVGRLGRTVLHGNRAFLPFLSRTFPDAPLTPRSDREIVHKWQQRTPNAGSVTSHAASSSGAEARGSSEGNGPRRVPVRPSIAPVPPMAPKNPVDV